MNVWLPLDADPGAPDASFESALHAVAPLYAAVGAPPPAGVPGEILPDARAQWDAVLHVAPTAISCVYGVPSAEMVRGAPERGVAVIGTATTVAGAVAPEAGGLAEVVDTGDEAAGPRVAFLPPPGDPPPGPQ